MKLVAIWANEVNKMGRKKWNVETRYILAYTNHAIFVFINTVVVQINEWEKLVFKVV